MLKTISLQSTLIALSLVTALGVFMHDSKLDQATTVAFAVPFGLSLAMGQAADAKPKLKTENHTHVERAMLDRTTHKSNIVPPRTGDRKYMLAKHARGFNAPEPHMLLLQPTFA